MAVYCAIVWLLLTAILLKTENIKSLVIFRVIPAAIAIWLAFDTFVIGIK